MILLKIIFLCLCYCQEDKSQIKEAVIGQTYTGMFTQSIQSVQIYQLVAPNIELHDCLLIVLKQVDENNNLSLQVSKNKASQLQPDKQSSNLCENGDMEMFPYAIKFCIIHNEFLMNEESLQIVITSNGQSSYTLQTQIQKEATLYLNEVIGLQMNNNQLFEIINFYIDEKPSQGTEIEIIVQQNNTDRIDFPFNIFLYEHKQGVLNKRNDYSKGYGIKENIQGLSLKYALNQNHYKILIQSSESSIFQIYSHIKSEIINIKLKEEIETQVQLGQYIQYEIFTTNQKSEFYAYDITIKPFQGTAKLYINPNKLPSQPNQSEWSYTIQRDTTIEISYLQIQNLELNLESLYFIIYGEEFCPFTFQVKLEEGDKKNTQARIKDLENNKLFMGKIFKGEVVVAFITAPNINNTAINLKIQQQSENVHFIITNCFKYDKCNFDDEFQMKEQISNDSQVKVIHDFNFQENDYQLQQEYYYNDDFIVWNLIIYLDKNSEYGSYSIFYTREGIIYYLKENTMRINKIEKSASQIHKFEVEEIDGIENLTFLITPIQGKLKMQLYFNETLRGKYDIESKTQQISVNGKIETGIYYLKLEGETFTEYGILPKVQRTTKQFGMYPWHYTKLFQGVSISQTLESDQIALFQINFNNILLFRYVYIKLEIIFGSFYVCGSDELIIDDTLCKFQFEKNEFFVIEPQIIENFFIKVKLQEFNQRTSFKIHYNYYNGMNALFLNQTLYSYLPDNNYKQLTYMCKENEQFIINTNIYGNQSSYLSIQFDQEDQFFVKNLSKTQILVRAPYKSKKNCVYLHQNLCQIFANFNISARGQSFFSITITPDQGQEMQLIEKVPIKQTFPYGENTYFINIKVGQANIILFSQKSGLTMYANFNEDESKKYPNQDNYDKISQKHLLKNYSFIDFSESEIQQKNCFHFCQIKITIINSNYDFDLNESYTLYYNSENIKMLPQLKYYDQLDYKAVKFYKIVLENDEENLMILANVKDNCKVDIYITKDHYSNEITFDWSLKDILQDIILIEAGNILHPKMSGQYNVGVYGQIGCQYEIEYLKGRFNSQDIKANVPYEFNIQNGEVIYLFLYTEVDANYHIQFLQNKLNGTHYYIDYLSKEQKVNAFSKQTSQYKYNNENHGYQNNQKIYLTANNYIILKIYGKSSQKVYIQVNKEIEYIELYKNIKLDLEMEKDSKQQYLIRSSKPITIFVQLFLGSLSLELSKPNQLEQLSKYEIKPLENNESIHRVNISCENQSNIDFYIIGLHKTSFNIWFKEQESQLRRVDYLSPISLTLEPMIPQLFNLVNNQDQSAFKLNDSKVITITLQLLNTQQVSNQIKLKIPEILIYPINDYKKNIPKTVEQISNDIIYYINLDLNIEYEISIKSSSNFKSIYQLSILNNGIIPILNNNSKYFTSQNQTTYFYYSIKQNYSKIFLQIHSFSGSYLVYTNSNLNELINKPQLNETQVKQFKSKFLVKDIENNKQSVFFNVKKQVILENENDSGCYTIKVFEVQNPKKIPYQVFSPGNRGVINTQSNEIEQFDWILTISFMPLNVAEETVLNNYYQIQYIEYIFYLNKIEQNVDQNIEVFCNNEQYENTIIQQTYQKNKQFIQAFNLSSDYLAYQVNILARVYLQTDSNEIISLDYSYIPNIVQKPSNQDAQTNYGILVVKIILVLLSISLLVYLLQAFLKKKQYFYRNYTNQTFQLEPQDNSST